MATEIERKFLVRNDDWRTGATGTPYWQGYLCNDTARSVRVRIAGDKAFLTIKGASTPDAPLSRPEFDYPLPVADAEQLLQTLCEKGQIKKTRYRVPFAGLVWEVDSFHGDNEGLVIAEIELEDENQIITHPSWIGEEVSHDPRYLNASLARAPFKTWKDKGAGG